VVARGTALRGVVACKWPAFSASVRHPSARPGGDGGAVYLIQLTATSRDSPVAVARAKPQILETHWPSRRSSEKKGGGGRMRRSTLLMNSACRLKRSDDGQTLAYATSRRSDQNRAAARVL
jgi:hypothetical protein